MTSPPRTIARLEVPVVPRGGGTSLAGQTAGGRGLVLDTSRHMHAIGEVSDNRVVVGPGVVQEDLNRAVRPSASASARIRRRPTGPRSAG